MLFIKSEWLTSGFSCDIKIGSHHFYTPSNKNAEQTENKWLFLDLPDNLFYRANHTLKPVGIGECENYRCNQLIRSIINWSHKLNSTRILWWRCKKNPLMFVVDWGGK